MAHVVAWTSRKASLSNANKQFAKEVEKQARKGYVLQSSNTAPAGRSKRSWVFLGLFNFIRGKQVQVTATFVQAPQGGMT